MRRDQLNRHKTATYVLRRHKVVYVSVNKAACTSLKWLVADLQGEDPARFQRSLSREVGRAMTIHRRALWQHTPMLHQLDDDELAGISPEDGWLIFSVVRHPAARLFSAWQSKFLLREPRWQELFGHEPWFPRLPAASAHIVEDFRRFVHAMAAEPDQPVMRDRHFMPQSAMVAADRMPYSRVYRTNELSTLLVDLRAHLERTSGWTGPLALRQSNETPLRPTAALFDPAVRAAIEELYESDFRDFGFGSVVPDKLHDSDEYDGAALAEIGRLVERHERIGDLALRAQQLKRASAGSAPAADAPAPNGRTSGLPIPGSALRRVRRYARTARSVVARSRA